MILWLEALPGFLTISSVCRLFHILSLVVPATVFTYFGMFGSHYNSSVGSVQSTLQNVKSQHQFVYWKVLTTNLLELGAIFLSWWSIRVSGVSATYTVRQLYNATNFILTKIEVPTKMQCMPSMCPNFFCNLATLQRPMLSMTGNTAPCFAGSERAWSQ